MEVKVRHIYDQSVDTVFKNFGNKASIERKFKELGARNINVETCKLTNTSLDIVMDREVPVNAPTLLKKFLGEWNLAQQEEHWKGIAGKSYQADVKITIKGVPVTITGKMVLAGDAKGCTNDVTLKIESGIPLLGKKLAEFVGQTSLTEMQREYEHNKGSFVDKKPSTKTVTKKAVSAKSAAKAGVKSALKSAVKTPAVKASTHMPAPVIPVGAKPAAKSVAAKSAAKAVTKNTVTSEPAAKKAKPKPALTPSTVKKLASKKLSE